MRKRRNWLILILVACLATEFASLGGLFLLGKVRGIGYAPADALSREQKAILAAFIHGNTHYLSYSLPLGWSIRKSASSPLYRANSLGIRSSREYSRLPPRDTLRIASFGDSFTHGDDVANDETYQVLLEALRPRWEVLNFGVGGYGLDQAYLRYVTEGAGLAPHIVFIGFMAENIYRSVNCFRPFYTPETQMPLAKPRFVLKDGKLSLLDNPLRSLQDYQLLLSRPAETLARIGAQDYYYPRRYKSGRLDFLATVRLLKVAASEFGKDDQILVHGRYNEASEAFQITRKLFDDFYAAAIKHDALPIILVFPDLFELDLQKAQGATTYASLVASLTEKGYLAIDLRHAFEGEGEGRDYRPLFNVSGHYSALGNRLVAQYLAAYLASSHLETRHEVSKRLIRLRSELKLPASKP